MTNHGTLSKHRIGKQLAKSDAQYVPVPRLPVEWYGNNSWRLPSGKALAEFALQAGFLAPLLFKTGSFGSTGLPPVSSTTTRAARSFKKSEHV